MSVVRDTNQIYISTGFVKIAENIFYLNLPFTAVFFDKNLLISYIFNQSDYILEKTVHNAQLSKFVTVWNSDSGIH